MKDGPAFQCYPKDLLTDTEHLTNEEFGAYWRLICQAWIQDGLSTDEGDLMRASRAGTRRHFRGLWSRIGEFFSAAWRSDGRLSQKRLEQTRQTQRLWREKSAKGGRARAYAKPEADGQPDANQNPTTLGRVVAPGHLPDGVPNANSPVSVLQSPDSSQDPPHLALLGEPPQGGQANGAVDKPRKARRVRARLPDEWAPSDDAVAYGKSLGFTDADLERIADEFCTYWWGEGKAKADWDATFENRLLTIKHGGTR